MVIKSGGVANSTTVNSGGYMDIFSGGTANNTTMDGGWMYISSGGVANSTTVNSGGWMSISSGGTATAIRENGGYVNVYYGANVTFVSNTIEGLTLSFYTSMTIHKNTVASSTTLSGGEMYISSGGVANSTTVNYGGSMYISSGGTANSTTLYYGAMYISNGGVANSTTLSGGDSFYESAVMSIKSGGVANSTTVNSGGGMYISSGGVANSTAVNSGGGMYISSGGVANSTTVNSWGFMYISSGGVANSTTVNSGGRMYISSGGTANSTTINSGCRMYISSGGTANSTTINAGGDMSISSGGTANSTNVNSGGWMVISSGGEATAIRENGGYVYVEDGANVTFVSNTIEGLTLSGSMTAHQNTVANSTTLSGGHMYISSGGVANSTTVNSGSDMYISSGGTANRTTVNTGGWIVISSGGVANSTTVNPNGSMCIYSGGMANSTTVNSGGYMSISSGGVHRGTLQINSGARISAYSGSTIDFTLTGRSASNGYLINDPSRIYGTPTFTITVSDSQEGGTYKLAQGADRFTGSITIGTDTLDYGTLAVNGSAVENDTQSYRLVKTDGNLNLVVEDKTAALPDLRMAEYDVSSNSITTQESVKLTFKVYNDGNADAPASTIKVYDGDRLLREVALGEIAAGSYRNCYITLTAGKLSVGTHKVNVVLDSGNAIAESREDNNNSYRTIFVKAPAAQADLRMAEYDVSSNSITTQESVKLTFKVYNDGNADAPASTIKVYDGDKLLREVALGEIAAGAYRNCYITIPAGKLSVGTHKVNVVLDAGNGIAESNENNNNSYRTIFVKAATAQPDLRMAEYDVSSNNITTQESVKLTFKVYNDGNADATASIIKVYDGDILLREVALGEIDAKGYRNCTITLVAGKLSVGTHKVNVVLDSGNLIAESNESNNNSYRTIFVKEPVRSSALADKADNAWDVSGTGSVDALCGGNYADLNEWSLENSAALTRSAADILTTDKEESRLLNSGKLAG